jgi:hypothetical protein
MKLNMTIDECLAFADEWSRGQTFHADSQGWRVVCLLLAEEVRRGRGEPEAPARGARESIALRTPDSALRDRLCGRQDA